MRATVLGVNGVTGRAIAAALATAGWEVRGTGRDPARFPAALRALGVHFLAADRHEATDQRRALAGGADLVVDCLCFTAAHARELLAVRDGFGSAVVLSSKAVYADACGRHSNSDEAPRFDRPVTERQSVLKPDFSGDYQSRSGYGTNKVAAELTLLESGAPVSILRVSRVHGPHAGPAREWFVVRRLLDGRRRFAVAHRGEGANHPTAAENLARLVLACAQRPGARVLNCADPGTPTAGEMVSAIAAAAGCEAEVVALAPDAPSSLGWTPWSSWPPFWLDTTAAAELGYEPAGDYRQTVRATVDWLCGLDAAGRRALDDDPYFAGRLDYALDDRALASARSRRAYPGR